MLRTMMWILFLQPNLRALHFCGPRVKPHGVRRSSCCLTILPLVVGRDILGYESKPLPSYNNLRNHYYSIMFKLKQILCLLRIFMYHVLIPSPHHPACPWPLLCLGTELIDGLACHLYCYGRLPSLNVLPNGV